MSREFNTEADRERVPVLLLEEKTTFLQKHFCDKLHDLKSTYRGEGECVRLRTAIMRWTYGSKEFIFNYSEVNEAPGSAIFRIRAQDVTGKPVTDNWEEIKTLGEFDGLLRKLKKDKGYTGSDRKAQRENTKHEGETPKGLILVGLSGSRAYNLHHEGYLDKQTGIEVPPSDTDTRGIFVLPTIEVLSIGDHQVLVEQKETDTKYDEVQRFMALCIKCNPERLEMLASPKSLVSEDGRLILENKDMFLSKGIIKTYGGYANAQLYRIERKAERQSKPGMHLIRLLITGTRALAEGFVDCDMTDYRDQMMAIRTGEMTMEDVLKWYRELEVGFNKAAEITKLPDQPDMARINKVLLAIRRNNLKVWE
jgi:predicted nucleotidyltransferase